MKPTNWLIAIALVTAVAVVQAQDTFKVLKTKGRVSVTVGDDKQKAEEGKEYAYGTKVETSRWSSAQLELSKGNEVRVMAKACVVITRDVKNAKVIRVSLDMGEIEVETTNMAKGESLEVATPSAVCGAVGSRYKIGVSRASSKEQDARAVSLTSDKGKMFLESVDEAGRGKSFRYTDIAEGTEVSGDLYPGDELTYTDVTVNRGSMKVQYGSGSRFAFVVNSDDGDDARFELASQEIGGKTRMVMRCHKGSVSIIDTKTGKELDKLTPDFGEVFVNDKGEFGWTGKQTNMLSQARRTAQAAAAADDAADTYGADSAEAQESKDEADQAKSAFRGNMELVVSNTGFQALDAGRGLDDNFVDLVNEPGDDGFPGGDDDDDDDDDDDQPDPPEDDPDSPV